MKFLLPASKLLLIMTLQICLTNCGQDSKLDIGSPEELSFREKVTDDFYCYMLSGTLSQKNETKRFHKSSFRMMSEKFCVPTMVEYYACFSTRKILSTNDQCERPSPPPSESEIRQCANDVSDYLSNYIVPKAEERAKKGNTAIYKQEYSECVGENQDGKGLGQYH